MFGLCPSILEKATPAVCYQPATSKDWICLAPANDIESQRDVYSSLTDSIRATFSSTHAVARRSIRFSTTFMVSLVKMQGRI